MKNQKMKLWSILAGLMIFFSVLTPAYAEDLQYFLGAGFGGTSLDGDVSNRSRVYYNDEDTGFKVFAGYMFKDWIGLELGYANFGEAELQGDNGSSFQSNGGTYTFSANDSRIKAEAASWFTGVILVLPMDKATGSDGLKWLNPFLKAGGQYYDVEFDVHKGSMSAAPSNYDGFNFYLGGGINFDFFRYWAFRTEFEYFPMDDGIVEDVYLYSGSLILRF